MSLFVADPEWGWWIILYFYCGGIAAGVYFLAALIELFGRDEDRGLVRLAHWIAFPLVGLCGLFLTVDLERPERFWHMLLQSERVEDALHAGWPFSGAGWPPLLQALLLKPWSPMSIGAWALFLFGLCSFVSFLGSLWPEGRLARRLRHSRLGRGFQVLGVGVGFFVASYTGVLLTAGNQPGWAASNWIGPLFLTSAASTGAAVLLLAATRYRLASPATLERLEQADLWALVLELTVFQIFVASLGGTLLAVLGTWHGAVLILGTLVFGLLAPLALALRLVPAGAWRGQVAAGLALVGGFLLRYGIVGTPADLLANGPPADSAEWQRPLWDTWQGKVVLMVGLLLALVVVLALSRGQVRSMGQGALVGTAFLLACGMVLFQALAAPAGPEEARRAPGMVISPEDGRDRGGGPGASGQNLPANPQPRSKLYGEEGS
jgi:formate-dependent nitrite reductase membrane component NrfD